MKTVTKPAAHLIPGDVVESPDGFELHYLRVSNVELDNPISVKADGTYRSNAHYVVRGVAERANADYAEGDPGELYLALDEAVEVVA